VADVQSGARRHLPHAHLARRLQNVLGMEISEGTRLEKALVVAACFPFLMLGLLFLFA
jgi:hypothetical protein